METRAADGSFLGDLGTCGLPGARGRLREPRAASAYIRLEQGRTRSEGSSGASGWARVGGPCL